MKCIHDIEIFSNLFLNYFYNIETKEKIIFEISPRKNQCKELVSFLSQKPTIIGYNNIGFDYPLLYYFLILNKKNLTGSKMVLALKKRANELVNNQYPPNLPLLFPVIDLMRIWHYDRKKISLKTLQFALRKENIQTLPYKHDSILTDSQIDNVIDYCFNDIDSTYSFNLESLEHINIREYNTQLYNHNFINYSDAKMGEIIIELIMIQKTGKTEFGQSHYDSIDLKDVIFDYINFETEPFKKILEFFKEQKVSELKGTFNNIPFEKLEKLEGYYIKKNKTTREDKTPKQDDLNILYNDVKIVYGSGGIHSSIKGIVEEDNDNIIIDIDVN